VAPLLSFQPNGNISLVTDAGIATTYEYDDLDRLWKANGQSYSETYSYTIDNNLHNKTTTIGTSTTSRTYSYNDVAHKHAVTSLSTGESYSYGANGNMY
jgi:hypothetical protein